MPPETQQNKPTSIRSNVEKLMTDKMGKTRRRGVLTLAKKRNISINDARFHQAVKISQKLARKK